MTRLSLRSLAAALALLLAAAARSQADPVNWQYNATPGATNVFSDNAGDTTSRVIFSNEGEVQRTDNTFITAANLSTESNQAVGSNAVFTNRAFSFTVAFRDGWDLVNPNGLATQILTFHGTVSGTLWDHGSRLTYTLSDPTQQITVGNHTYTLDFDTTGRIPGPHDNSRQGSISGDVSVQGVDNGGGGGTPHGSPEPGTAVLAGFGLLGLAGVGYRRLTATR